MTKYVSIGSHQVGHGQPVFVTAEIGINHNGDLELAQQLIDAAVAAGCDAVKFQKRTPDLCVPPEQRNRPRETPWGLMTYLEYRHRVEFEEAEYRQIDEYCRLRGIEWFASCWDEQAVDFMERFEPSCYKIASASLTDEPLLDRLLQTGRPLVLSTGMSTIEEICTAVSRLGTERLVIAHSTSTYPCKPEHLNLAMIPELQKRFGCPVGYSGHEVGLQATIAAVALGACFVERHVTLDRSMWGSDQAASVEPQGLIKMVRDIRIVEKALGDGVKRVYEEELPVRAKLRRNVDARPVELV